MRSITVDHHPSPQKLQQLGVYSWPVWEKEVSEFDWHYDSDETCYILDGHVFVTPEGGAPVEIRAGDFVVFPAGMSCTWKITQPIRKHYKFS
jgi:hypothetical protein